MIVDKDTAKRLGREDWSSLPDRKTGIVRKEFNEELGIYLTYHKYPEPQKDDAMVQISHSVTVTDEDDGFIFCAQLESIDLRILAGALGVSVKDLQEEYRSKAPITPARTVLYGNEDREDLGVYLGEKKDDSLFDFLEDIVCDTFVEKEDEDWSEWLVEDDK